MRHSKELHIRISQNTSKSVLGKQKNKRFSPAASLSYISIAVLILSVLSIGRPSDKQGAVFGAVSALTNEQDASSIDKVAAANLAANVAKTSDISVKVHVTNRSTSLNARAALAQSSQEFASKPLMLSDDMKDLVAVYEVKRGDSLEDIAAKHDVSTQTIKWANGLTENRVELGAHLRIPSIDGVLYSVQEGDTAAKLAQKYKASEERIVSFNNAELSGLQPGSTIIIPGGVLPEGERPGDQGETQGTSSTSGTTMSGSYDYGSSTSAFTPSYSVGYPFGWCTYYAAAKTGAPGNWGNANTWDDYGAQTPGWTVSSAPVPGAIAQRDGGYGHVAVVEAVSSDGTMIKYSDMNGLAGFGAVGHSGWAPVSEFSSYIYR